MDPPAIEEPVGGGVADLGPVLPAIPQFAHHRRVLGRFLEPLRDRRHRSGSDVSPIACRVRHLQQPTPAATGDEVERRNLGRQQEGLGEGRAGRGDDPHVARVPRHATGHHDRVEPPPHPVGSTIGPVSERRLQSVRVLEGDEIEPSPFDLAHLFGPVGRAEQPGRAGPRLAPRGRVPTCPVKRHRKMHGANLDNFN